MALPFIPLPFGIKVEVAWETGSGIAVCIHFFQKISAVAVNSTDLTNAISLVDTWRTAIRPVQPATMVISGIRATDWSVAEGATQLNVPSANIAGSDVGAVMPMNVAVVASHYTGFTGRSKHGRNYIPGIGENVVAVGDIVGALFRNYIITAYTGMAISAIAANLAFVVASFNTLGARRVTGIGTLVTQTQVDQYSDSQRRRLAGRGA